MLDSAELPRTAARSGAVCVACGGTLGSPRRLGTARLAACPRCGTRTEVPRPTAADLRAIHDSPTYFEKEYFEARRVSGSSAERFRRIRAAVAGVRGPGFLSGRRMLDVGCDTGELLLAAQADAAIEPVGVEVSTRAADVSRNRGVTVWTGELVDAPEDFDGFALVTCIDVLEHVVEPVELLESIAARLAPDGLVYVETPNWRSAVYRAGRLLATAAAGRPRSVFERLFPQEHVQYFTLAGMRALIDRTPLSLLRLTTRPLEFGAVAGGPVLRAATWAAQLPDRGSERELLVCALLELREGA